MRALVTGGGGFIGGATAARLLSLGWPVTLLLRPGAHPPQALSAASVIYADLGQCQSADLRAILPECDVVIHAAAIRNRWGTSAEAYWQVNASGTQQLVDASTSYAHHFVYISSVGVYGYPGRLEVTEEAPVIPLPANLDYHTSKLLAERAVQARAAALHTTILRPTITYGPGDRDGMLPRMARLIRQRRLPLIGSGQNYLHLTYIDDLVDAILAACANPRASGQVYNVSGPAPVRFRDLATEIATALNTPLSRISIPRPAALFAGWLVENLYRAGKISSPPPITRQMVNTVSANRSFSHSKARDQLGFLPRIRTQDGLPLALHWMAQAGIV